MEEVSDINPTTHISKDYVKTFGPLNQYIRSLYGKTTTERIKQFSAKNLAQHRFRTYTEWFPIDEFSNVVHELNINKVTELESIVEKLNCLVKGKKILVGQENPANYKPLKLFNRAMSIILGHESFDFKAICEKGDAEINKYFW